MEDESDPSSLSGRGGGSGGDQASAAEVSSEDESDHSSLSGRGGGSGGDQAGVADVSSSGGFDASNGGAATGPTDEPIPNPGPGDLVISEVMANSHYTHDFFGEYFEVYNVSPTELSLQGLVVRHDPAQFFTITTPLTAAPGAYLVFARNGDPATNGGINADYVTPEVDEIEAQDFLSIELADGTLIDRIDWVDAPYISSRNLDPAYLNASQNDSPQYWCPATSFMPAGDKGTPGAPNDVCPEI